MTSDHRRNNVVQYFCCKRLAELTPAGRFILLKEKGLCHQCLAPGAPLSTSKHRQDCFSRYCCKNKIHEKHVKKKHVLVCEEHKHHQENKELLEEYRNNCILRLKENLPEFTKQISFHSKSGITKADTTERNKSNDVEKMESAIYILQTIEIQSERFNIFFDNGCGDLVSRRDGVSRLQKLGQSSQERPGPIRLMGVGNQISECKHDLYKVSLPLFNGREAVMSGVCVYHVTARFPTYPLKEEVESDIINAFKSDWRSKGSLSKLPCEVGGDTDFMVGIKYLKYFPKVIFRLPSGLTIYESVFLNPDGSRGVVGGPHEVFTSIEKKWAESNISIGTFCKKQLELVKMGYRVSVDMPLLAIKDYKDVQLSNWVDLAESNPSATHSAAQKSQKLFETVENAGTEITYRCVDCRDCINCKRSEQIEYATIQE